MAGKKLSQMTPATSVSGADGAPILQGGNNRLAPFSVVSAHFDALHGVVNVLSHGGTGLGEADESSAFQSACDEAEPTGGVVLVPPGTWRINSQVTVPEGVELRLSPGATIIHGADTDLFRIKQGARFSGGRIDVSSTAISTYTSNVFEVAGADRTDGSLLGGMTYIGTEIHGKIEDLGATAFYLHSSGENSHIYRLHIDALVYGLTNGVRMVVSGGEDSTGWINGNKFDLRCTYTKTPIKQEIGTGNKHIDGNIFDIEFQSYPLYEAPLIELEGRYNQVRGNIWDHPSAIAVTCAAGTLYNNFYVGGLSLDQISDGGYYNTFFLTTQTQAGLKIDRLYANTDSLLLIDHDATRLPINAAVQWLRSGGGLAARLFTEGDWLVAKSENAGVQLQSKTMSIFKTDGAEQMRLTSASGDLSGLYLWDATNNKLQRVSYGAADSGGEGYRALRVPNS